MIVDMKALKEAAERASDGPWFARGGTVWIGEEGKDPVYLTRVLPLDAEHIALANPSAILSLIERVEELEGALRQMQEYAIKEIQRGGAHHDPVWARVADALSNPTETVK